MKAPPHLWRGLLALALGLLVSAGCTNAQKTQRLLTDANRDFNTQQYEKAEIEYQAVRSYSPLNAVAIRQLGLLYSEEGRQEAYPYLKKALELEPTNTEVQLKMAEIYGSMLKTNEAVDLVTKVLQAEPANEHAWLQLVEASPASNLPAVSERLETMAHEGGPGGAVFHSALGWIDLRTKKTNEAAAEFQNALALDPKLASPHMGEAVLCSIQNDLKGSGQALKAAAELSPLRSATRLKYVDYELQLGSNEVAREVLLNITTNAPDYVPAWLDLARLYFSEHKYDDCKTTLKGILAKDNANFEALMQLGTLALAQHDAGQALKTFERIDAARNNNPVIKYNLALAHLMNNEKAKAVNNLNNALALNPNYSSAALLLAELDFRSGDLTGSATLLLQLVKRHPENAQAQLSLAETFLALDQPDQALEVYQKMEQVFPKNPEVPRRMGVVCERKRDFVKARAAFEKSLSLVPDYLPALEKITGLDIYEKHYEEAHRRLDAVVEKNPKAVEPMLLQGQLYLAEGQTNKAEAAYSKAIQLNPEQPAGYLSLARIYLESHQEKRALNDLTNLVAKTNDLSALMMIGVLEQTEGHYQEAGDTYEKLLTIHSNYVTAMNNLSYVDSEYLGKLKEALKLAETARRLRPMDPYAADTLGWILYKNHDYARALNLIQESAEKQLGRPGWPEVQLHLGLTYYMLGEEKPARQALQEALASSSEFPDKDLARPKLEILNIDPAHATPEIISKVEALVKKDPKDPVPLSRFASIQERRGDYQGAAESLQTILEINPQNWLAKVRLARLEADHLGEDHKAMTLAQQAHDLAPNDGEASALLSELAYRSEDYPWALSLLEQAAGQSTNQPSLFYHLALAYYAVGKVKEADASMQRAADLGEAEPHLAQAKEYLAFRAAFKDPAQTRACAAQARQVGAKDPNYASAQMVVAKLSEMEGHNEEAGQICQKLLLRFPLFAPAMREWAIIYSHSQNAGDLDKAYKLGEKAREAMPDDLELAKTLGLLAYGRPDYDRSALFLQEYSNECKTDGEAFCYLGLDYLQLRDTNRCRLALQRAVDLKYSGALAGKAQSILRQLK